MKYCIVKNEDDKKVSFIVQTDVESVVTVDEANKEIITEGSKTYLPLKNLSFEYDISDLQAKKIELENAGYDVSFFDNIL